MIGQPVALQVEQLLTVADVMRICRVHRDRAFQVMHAAGAFKLGRSLRLRPEDLDRYLEALAVGAAFPGADARPVDRPRHQPRHPVPQVVSLPSRATTDP